MYTNTAIMMTTGDTCIERIAADNEEAEQAQERSATCRPIIYS